MKVHDAMLPIYIDDEYTLANNRDIEVAEVVPVLHNPSFYTMFYKMTIENRQRTMTSRRRRRIKKKEEKMYLFFSIRG